MKTLVNTGFMWLSRAMAVALEQENKTKIHDARVKVALAEVEVPLAMAEAFRNGNLGIMDYYKMKISKPIPPCVNPLANLLSCRISQWDRKNIFMMTQRFEVVLHLYINDKFK